MKIQIGKSASALLLATGAMVTLLVELMTLSRIFGHVAANRPMPLPLSYAVIAALPVLLLLAVYILKRHARMTARDLRAFIGCWCIGIVGALVALAQYSDSTPGILVLAYSGQWFVVLRYSLTKEPAEAGSGRSTSDRGGTHADH